MINTQGLSPEKIRMLGLDLLNRELGPDGMIEFIQQYSTGSGDYSKERKDLFKGESVASLAKELFDLQDSIE